MNLVYAVVLVTVLVGAVPGLAQPLEVAEQLPAPDGFVPLSPCVAQMGAHYARKSEMPLGPILGYDEQGRLIFFEYMISRKAFQTGITWTNLPGLAGRSVDHIQIDYNPHGPPGFTVPHYDIHLYLISADAQRQVCPNGLTVEPAKHHVHYTDPVAEDVSAVVQVGAPR